MFWVAWKGYNGGKAVSLGAIEQVEAETYGMHGYPTEAQAEAHPNSVNAIEKTQVNAWIVAANDITGNPGKDAAHAAKSAASAAGSATGISSVVDFLKGLTTANLWIRVAKVAAGGIMLMVGLAHLTGFSSSPTVNKAVKMAPLL